MELQKGDHQPNQESEQTQAKVKIYHWTYDDGSSIVVLSEAGKQTIREFQDYARFKAFLKKTKKRIKTQGSKLKEKSDEIQSGLLYSVAEPQYLSQYDTGFQNFKALLSSCGNDATSQATILELVSSAFAAYHAHAIKKCWRLPDHEKLAGEDTGYPPSLLISDREPIFNTLSLMIESVAMETVRSGKKELWTCAAPLVLPTENYGGNLIDHACIYYNNLGAKKADHPFPMEYRETAVLLNAKLFTAKELLSFQRRNPWATIVLYGATPSKILSDFIRIDGKVFTRCDDTCWDAANLNKVISAYLYWLVAMIYPQERGKKKRAASSYFPSTAMSDYDVESFNLWLFDEWEQVDQRIFTHNSARGTKTFQRTYWRWKRLQMVSMSTFLYFFKMANAISEKQFEETKREWWNLLLPGCYPEADVEQTLPITERSVIDLRQSSKEVFEATLQEILQAALPTHIVFHPANSPEPEGKPWGCLRWYFDKTHDQSFKALIFPTRKLRTLGPKYCPVRCDWAKVIPELRKKPPAYLYPVKACRLWGRTSPQDAIIINVQKAKFLSSEVRVSINRLFQEGSE